MEVLGGMEMMWLGSNLNGDEQFLKFVIKVGYLLDFGVNNCKLMMELDFERIPLIYWKLSVSAFYFYVCLNSFFQSRLKQPCQLVCVSESVNRDYCPAAPQQQA